MFSEESPPLFPWPTSVPPSPFSSQQSPISEVRALPPPPSPVILHPGLVGQDANLDLLMALYEQLQVGSVETAHEDNFLLFVENAYYFAVIHKAPDTSVGPDAWERDYFSPSGYSLKPPYCLGFVYLTHTAGMGAESGLAELSIGIIITPEERGKGYARAAIKEVLCQVFDKRSECHRIQALVVQNYYKEQALNLFTQLGFGHEGTRRRSFYGFGEWKDTTCLGILNTDWVMRKYFKPAPKTLWDEMLVRHDRERNELLRWEERKMGSHALQRTASTETIRGDKLGTTSSSSASFTDSSQSDSEAAHDFGSETVILDTRDEGAQTHTFDIVPSLSSRIHILGDSDGSDVEGSTQMGHRDGPGTTGLFARGTSPTCSDYSSSGASTSQSAYPPSTCDSALSDWEMMDDDDDYFSPIDDDINEAREA
ncbi:hypothetical protein PQX77_010162 [Marasmius sp. AFHP31]|nr:hypothetical protein PQX77_010162 [Marasmius sp. AFHP31]